MRLHVHEVPTGAKPVGTKRRVRALPRAWEYATEVPTTAQAVRDLYGRIVAVDVTIFRGE